MEGAAGPRAGDGDRGDDMVAWLVAQGAEPEAAIAATGDAAEDLASELVLDRGAVLSARELAARTGLTLDRVVGMYRDVGVAVPDPDARRFSEHDAYFVERMAQAGAIGIVRGPDLLRVVAGAMERIAEAAVAIYVQGPAQDLRARGASALDRARASALATELALDLGFGLGPVFRHHMHQAVVRQRVMQAGVTNRELARLAVGFVDLVGSTALQAGLDPAALGDQVSRFEARAFDVTAGHGGRVVKFIGDAIMFAAADPAAGCRIVGDLIAAFTAEGTQPRGGLVFGEVLFRHGDYYGPVVNLAARLVDAAIPGEVLVDRGLLDAMAGRRAGDGGAPTFEPAGRRMLKGIAEPVAVWSLSTGS